MTAPPSSRRRSCDSDRSRPRGDPRRDGQRRAGLPPLDLREHRRRDAAALGQVPEREAHPLAQRADARAYGCGVGWGGGGGGHAAVRYHVRLSTDGASGALLRLVTRVSPDASEAVAFSFALQRVLGELARAPSSTSSASASSTRPRQVELLAAELQLAGLPHQPSLAAGSRSSGQLDLRHQVACRGPAASRSCTFGPSSSSMIPNAPLLAERRRDRVAQGRPRKPRRARRACRPSRRPRSSSSSGPSGRRACRSRPCSRPCSP